MAIDFFGFRVHNNGGGGLYIGFSFRDFKYQMRRKTVYAFHRARHGWAVPDTWSFDTYLADVIIGGIQHLRENKAGVPSFIFYDKDTELDEHGMSKMSMEEGEAKWNKILDEIVEGFEAWKKLDDFPVKEERIRLEQKFNRGMKLFHKNYGGLWD